MTQAANLAALGTNAGTTGILPAAGGGTAGTNGAIGFKNRIINGGMGISQRGSSFTSQTAGAYYLDRWQSFQNYGTVTVANTTTAPAGFTNSMSVTVTTANASPGSTAIYALDQSIEGFNVGDCNFGTVNAKTMTLSFWVRASIAGTYCVFFRNVNQDRFYTAEYTISAVDTWEQKSITFTGDTTGTWNVGNGVGIDVGFNLGSGTSRYGTAGAWTSTSTYCTSNQTNLIGTSGATFYITGVQLEVGTAATNFDVRSYGTEFFLCQRYFQVYYSPADYCHIWTGYVANDGAGQYLGVPFAVPMRAIPTGTITSYNTSAFGVPSLQLVSTSFIRASASPTGQNNRAYFQFNSTYSAEL